MMVVTASSLPSMILLKKVVKAKIRSKVPKVFNRMSSTSKLPAPKADCITSIKKIRRMSMKANFFVFCKDGNTNGDRIPTIIRGTIICCKVVIIIPAVIIVFTFLSCRCRDR